MTVTIAVIGKSGSGKTTLTKAILNSLHSTYPEKSILLVDNDMSSELDVSFGIEIDSTIHDIRCGRYKYKSKLPDIMSKQEFIEWVLQDIIVNLYDEVDLLVSGPVSSKDCRCFVAGQIDDALQRLVKSYDIVIFDCEYDLEYLHQLVDCPVDVSVIVADTTVTSVYAAAKIKDSSINIVSPGQIGLVLNKVKNRQIPENVSAVLNEYDLDILGTLPYDEELEQEGIVRDSKLLNESAKELLFRLNLPPL